MDILGYTWPAMVCLVSWVLVMTHTGLHHISGVMVDHP